MAQVRHESGVPGPQSLPLTLRHTLWVGLCFWAADLLLWVALYFRPSPFGLPFAVDPANYVFHAFFYTTWAQLIVLAPFVALATRRREPSRLWNALQASLSAALLVVAAVDREAQRFLGMHASMAWVRSYASVDRTPSVIWQTLRDDRGGAWSSISGLVLLMLALLIALLVAPPRFNRPSPKLLGTLLFAFGALPTLIWHLPGGKQRQHKVAPALLLVSNEIFKERAPAVHPAELASAVQVLRSQSGWSDNSWTYNDTKYPLLKHHQGTRPAAPAKRPNFIFLSLETFRAKDMGSMNPRLNGPSPTPFLDGLASADRSAFYRRYYASAIPTVHAFMSIHASLLPHPTLSIPAQATNDHIDGFPAMLRRAGYKTAHFTGSDPDWDSQRVWLNRWYDEVHYHAEDKEQDRRTFRRAAVRIKELARSGQPFLAYIASISNHTPFRSPEPAFASEASDAVSRLHGTMRYTDDVLREFYGTLRGEPWFDDTIWIITGDHGFDLGDRGESGSHDNLRHETTWVPLIVHGADARLPRGEQRAIGSHLDLAPTILELADVWADNAFLGHSLLHARPESAETVIVRGGVALETPQHSLFVPAHGAPFVYEGADLEQQKALPRAPQQLVDRATALAAAYRVVTRYVIDSDRVAPRSPTGAAGTLAHGRPSTH